MPKKGRAIGLGLLAVLAAAALAMLTLGRDSLPALGRLFSPGPGILDDPAGLVRRDMPAVPVLLQKPELPAGCEATAAAMLLGAYGYAVSKEEMARAIPRAPFEKRDGRVYGPDPRDMYAGDPFSAEGYGVYADTVAAAMQREIDRLGGGASVYLLEAEDEGAVLAAVDAGYPVCIWATMNMAPTQKGSSSWYLLEDGAYTDEKIEWLGNEHCLVLTGYGADTVTVNDPLAGRKTYGRAVFFARWREQGRQAILVAPDKK